MDHEDAFGEFSEYEGVMMDAHNVELQRIMEMEDHRSAVHPAVVRMWRRFKAGSGPGCPGCPGCSAEEDNVLPLVDDEPAAVHAAFERARRTAVLGSCARVHDECCGRVLHIRGSGERLVAASRDRNDIARLIHAYRSRVRKNLFRYVNVLTLTNLVDEERVLRLRHAQGPRPV